MSHLRLGLHNEMTLIHLHLDLTTISNPKLWIALYICNMSTEI
jgi:hypothetical protein